MYLDNQPGICCSRTLLSCTLETIQFGFECEGLAVLSGLGTRIMAAATLVTARNVVGLCWECQHWCLQVGDVTSRLRQRTLTSIWIQFDLDVGLTT